MRALPALTALALASATLATTALTTTAAAATANETPACTKARANYAYAVDRANTARENLRMPSDYVRLAALEDMATEAHTVVGQECGL